MRRRTPGAVPDSAVLVHRVCRGGVIRPRTTMRTLWCPRCARQTSVSEWSVPAHPVPAAPIPLAVWLLLAMLALMFVVWTVR